MRDQSHGAGSSAPEVERNRVLLKQARGVGIAGLTAIYLVESGVIVLLFVIFVILQRWLGSGDGSGSIPGLVAFLVVIVLAAQANAEMRVNRRIDALVSLLVRKRMLDDEVADTRLTLDGGGSAPGKSRI